MGVLIFLLFADELVNEVRTLLKFLRVYVLGSLKLSFLLQSPHDSALES